MNKEKQYLLLNWVLLISYGCFIFFALYASLYSWPTQGSVIWFLLIIFCPAFLHHLAFIAYTMAQQPKQPWKKRYRVTTLVCGILLAGGLLQVTQKISLSRFKSAYSFLIARIEQKMPTPCDAHYFEIAQIQNYNRSVGQKILQQKKPVGGIYYNAERFVLHFQAGSVDNDNSRLFYDSQTKIWGFFHNDDLEAAQRFDARIQGLRQCVVF